MGSSLGSSSFARRQSARAATPHCVINALTRTVSTSSTTQRDVTLREQRIVERMPLLGRRPFARGPAHREGSELSRRLVVLAEGEPQALVQAVERCLEAGWSLDTANSFAKPGDDATV